VFVSQWESEGMDLQDLSFSGNQDALVAAVAGANPHTIVVLETGGPAAMPWIGNVSAAIEIWYPGIRGAEAAANILFGDVNPSAKLPVTFHIAGPGAIIGLNNGDPNCHEPEKGNQHSLFHGLAQVIVQSGYEGKGPLTLRATAPGLAYQLGGLVTSWNGKGQALAAERWGNYPAVLAITVIVVALTLAGLALLGREAKGRQMIAV